jgi:hypothetical protein
MSNGITAWSYSRYSLYKQCPLKFKLTHIDKLPQPKSPALERGIAIHQEAEDYLNGKHRAVPESLKKLAKPLKQIRDEQYAAEDAWGLTKDWEETGFFAQDVWLRLKIDAYGMPRPNVFKMIDFKTGKMRSGYIEQLELYAVCAFSIYDIHTVETELWYVDNGKIIDSSENPGATFHVEDYEKLCKRWGYKTKPMFNDKTFSPTPNQFCGWCHWRKENGGPCKC